MNYFFILSSFALCEAFLLVLVVASNVFPSMAWFRPYTMPLLVSVTLALLGAQGALMVITAMGFWVIQNIGGGGSSDLLKALQLALLLLGPVLALGIGVILGTIVGLVVGHRRVTRADGAR